ncbi:MAG: flavodoxin family protein [Spirochaetota bacterium]|nr:flavodoxin family protein [Spirochaetota bacterium]
MKSLVVYSSQTGNTRKLAQTVFDALTGEKDIFPIDKAPNPSGYDFIALGFWLKGGKPIQESMEYLSKIKEKSLFLFATHGAATGSMHVLKAMDYAKNQVLDSKIVGIFSCQGEMSPDFIEKIQQKSDPPEWSADAPKAKGHPNKSDLEELNRIIVNIAGTL